MMIDRRGFLGALLTIPFLRGAAPTSFVGPQVVGKSLTEMMPVVWNTRLWYHMGDEGSDFINWTPPSP